MRTLKLILAYDGADYRGWQVQPNGPTIQGELARAIHTITGESTLPIASGRTDAGVHALGQVVAWRTVSPLPCTTLRRALNANLPPAIVVRNVADAPIDFDPVRQAKWKLYRYAIHDGPVADPFLRRYHWEVHSRLDVDAIAGAAALIEGTHDFKAFETEWPNRASSVRTMRVCRVARRRDQVTIDMEANGFLYNMARAMVGTLVQVGRQRWAVERVGQLLANGSRADAGPTAPARGLFLVRVEYEDNQ